MNTADNFTDTQIEEFLLDKRKHLIDAQVDAFLAQAIHADSNALDRMQLRFNQKAARANLPVRIQRQFVALYAKDGKYECHGTVLKLQQSPDVIMWRQRAFAYDHTSDEHENVYVEVSVHTLIDVR